MLAADMRSGQRKVFAQKIGKQLARLATSLAANAVGGEFDIDQVRHQSALSISIAIATPRRIARPVRTFVRCRRNSAGPVLSDVSSTRSSPAACDAASR